MKRFFSIILLIVFLFVLSQTNPDRSEYVSWINDKSMDQSTNILKKGMLSVAGKAVFEMGTTEKNYFIFSIYKTDLSKFGMGKITSVGVFNHFVLLSKDR